MAPRLDTPLSKALLDSGSLDPSALEEAVQEQMIHGGALDTILLEKGAVDERVLAELLSKAWQTEPVPLHAIEQPAAAAVKALPERMALAMRLCPFAVEGTAVHVMCASPLDRALIEEVSGLLLKPLVPHVVPEVRVWQGLSHAYGTAPDERFASLLAELQVPSHARSDAGEDALEAMRDVTDPGAARWDLVEALAHLAAAGTKEAIARVAASYARKFMPFAAMIGVRFIDDESRHGPGRTPRMQAQCQGWLRSGPAEGVQFANKLFSIADDCVLDAALESPSPSLGKPAITSGNAAFFGWLGRRRPRTFLVLPIVIAGRAIGALVADGGIRPRDFASMSDLVAFGARLGPAFETLLRQRRASLAPQAAAPDEAPLLEPEPPPPLLEPLAPALSTTAAIDDVPPPPPLSVDDAALAADVPAPPPLPEPAAGAPRPITMVAMPAVQLTPPVRDARELRDGTSPFARNYSVPVRAAASEAEPPPPPPPPPVVVDDLSGLARIEAPAAFADVLDSRATEVWQGALQAAVARGHQGGTVAPEERARIFLDEDGWEDIRYETWDGTGVARAGRAEVAAPTRGAPVERDSGTSTVLDGAPITDEDPASPLEELVDHLDALDDATVERAKKKLLERGAEAVPALEARFPGRLRADPFDAVEAVASAARLGPLVDVLAALGPAGLDAAIPHLDSRYPAHRFAAVMLFALTPDPRGIDLLRARLHDQEPRIRQLAADALGPFVAHPRFEGVLLHLRERLQSPLLDARRRAVQLLGTFRDVGAVPLLMTILEQKSVPAELAEDARQSLRVVTLQDFGVRGRGWEKWWTRAKKRSRVDWLIEGLSSDDRELRHVAAVELAGIAGDDFGYRPDDAKKDRQRAITAFQNWWDTEQRRAHAG